MGNELANLLQNVIAQAKQLPAETGETGRYEQRMNGASSKIVLLLDTSGSMEDRAGSMRCIDILVKAVGDVIAMCQVQPTIIEFASTAKIIPSLDRLSEPAGGTALHTGLEMARSLKPKHTIILTDGQPNDEDEALRVADGLTGTIDVIFCGDENNVHAIDFCKRLSRVGMGRATVCDLKKANALPQLTMETRRLLQLTGPTGG